MLLAFFGACFLILPKPEIHKYFMNMRDNLLLQTPLTIVNLENVKLTKSAYRTAIIRIFGNNLYPLQDKDQGSRNLNFILGRENFNNAKSKYLWVVNRIVNQSESSIINQQLKDREKLDVSFDIRKLKQFYESDEHIALHYASDINNARNEALNHAASMDVDWVILLDGNVFLTDEAYSLIHSALDEAELSNKLMFFLPMYRFAGLQNSLNSQSKINQISGNLSGLQEPYFAIHRSAIRKFRAKGVSLFSSENAYGQRSKIASLETFANFYPQYLDCSRAYYESSVRMITTGGPKAVTLGLQCGYAIRLLYWPNGFDASARKDYSVKTSLLLYKAFLLDNTMVPEDNNSVRSSIRQDSIAELKRQIEQLVNPDTIGPNS